MPREITIIGGGIQGTTLALALAGRGVGSLIVEKEDRLLSQASLRNEGKLHLGFVYALDPTGQTTTAMVEGALTFSPLLERWCGEVDWRSGCSESFGYVVMEDSLASAAELEHHYVSVLGEIERRAGPLGDSYLGHRIAGKEVVRHAGSAPEMRSGFGSHWFETPERAIDPRLVCHHLEKAVADDPLIEVLTAHRVDSLERTLGGFSLGLSTKSGEASLNTCQVANCSWEGRPALDRQAFGEETGQCYRIKHQVVVRGGDAGALRPLTLVQGPYGDVVPWPNGDIYVSWYPVSRTHFGDSPVGRPRADAEVAGRTRDHIVTLVPGLDASVVVDHGACYIVAQGKTDIGDRHSGLHSRNQDAITESQGWWSLSAGKLTTAPLASERCAALITDTPVGL